MHTLSTIVYLPVTSCIYSSFLETAVSKIVKEGFRIGGEGIEIRNGAVYGKGI